MQIDGWGIAPRIVELWATGLRGTAIAKIVQSDVHEACAREGRNPPQLHALATCIDKYMKGDPVDRRTRQARNQTKVAELEVQAVGQIVQAQVNAAQILQRYVSRIDTEIDRLASVVERDEKTGAPVVPSMGTYYNSLTSLSREMRGWINMLIEMKDRLWRHEQYQQAFKAILRAVRVECTPETQQAIINRLNAESSVSNVLKSMGGDN